MTRLYPRLLPGEVTRVFERLGGLQPHEIEALQPAHPAFVFTAAGGSRVEQADLARLRSELTACAHEYGYPAAGRLDDLIAFDRTLARWLHAELDVAAGEASSRAVWAYISLVVAPHVAAWRFPARQAGYTKERFDGTDLTRNTFSRLWWRGEVLRDDALGADAYTLLDALGEEAMDQLMARRRSLAASPALARAIVRAARSREDDLDRTLFRDALQRLLRLSAFVDFEAIEPVDLDHMVQEEFEASARALNRGV